MEEKIFKAYDIRGIFPDELDEEAAYKIGRAFILFLKKSRVHSFELAKTSNLKIVVGMDNRLSSGVLSAALEKGIMEQGGDIIDIGFCTTPMFYFTVAKFDYDGGLMITASHNPSEYNGFKMVNKGGIPISDDTGIKQIKEMALSGKFEPVAAIGSKEKKDVMLDYIQDNQFNEDFNFTIVVDTANSVSGVPVKRMLSKVPLIHIFDELDGNFPNHAPDPLKMENMRCLQVGVKAANANLGVAFDGDGDRLFFVDENSQVITADLVLALMSSIILRKKGKQKILYDLRCSNIVPETIKKWGGEAIITRVGHSFIKEVMRKEDAIFGGEFSGHFFYKNAFCSEAPFFVLFSVLNEMKKTNKTLSQLIAPFRKYFHSEEVNFKISNPQEKIKQIKEKYSKGTISEFDGLRIDFENWWLLVRASNTEPVLRLMVEAETQFMMDQKLDELSKIINE